MPNKRICLTDGEGMSKRKEQFAKQTVATMKVRVWKTFSEYIRKRDCLCSTGSLEYGECITCDNQFEYKDLQAGHFIAGRHNGNLFSERGTHAQCKQCNCFKGGMPLEYRRQIVKLYGEGVDEELEEEARQTKKFTVSELEGLLETYQQKIKSLEGGMEKCQ